MKVIEQSVKVLGDISSEDPFLARIANAARACYKTDMSDATPEQMLEMNRSLVRRLISSHHDAMLEHAYLTVDFVTDRGVANELVRHRVASYAQESTRYCNYSKDRFGNDIKVIAPIGMDPASKPFQCWAASCMEAEREYMSMIAQGVPAEVARDVLPLCLATEIIVTANIREWRHIFDLRLLGTTGKPHPKMRALMGILIDEVGPRLPILFGDQHSMYTLCALAREISQ